MKVILAYYLKVQDWIDTYSMCWYGWVKQGLTWQPRKTDKWTRRTGPCSNPRPLPPSSSTGRLQTHCLRPSRTRLLYCPRCRNLSHLKTLLPWTDSLETSWQCCPPCWSRSKRLACVCNASVLPWPSSRLPAFHLSKKIWAVSRIWAPKLKRLITKQITTCWFSVYFQKAVAQIPHKNMN